MFLACHQPRSPFLHFQLSLCLSNNMCLEKYNQYVFVQLHNCWTSIIILQRSSTMSHGSRGQERDEWGFMKWWMGWSQEKRSMYWCIKEVKNKLYQLSEDGFENCYNKGSFNEIHSDAIVAQKLSRLKQNVALHIEFSLHARNTQFVSTFIWKQIHTKDHHMFTANKNRSQNYWMITLIFTHLFFIPIRRVWSKRKC